MEWILKTDNRRIKCTVNGINMVDKVSVVELIDNDKDTLIDEIIKVRKKKKYKVTRSKVSYVREVKAHNRLYKLGLFESHTMHSDLEENIVWWKDIFYWVIGW